MSSEQKLAKQMFANIVRPHLPHLYRFAYRLTSHKHDAEDLLQDLLIKAYRNIDQLERIESPRPWLAKIMYRQFVDSVRKRTRRRVRLVTDHEFAENPDLAPIQHGGPERETENEFNLASLQRCLKQLSENHRVVILMHDTEGYTLSEIAEITETSIGTVKSRLSRGRYRLRELLRNGTK